MPCDASYKAIFDYSIHNGIYSNLHNGIHSDIRNGIYMYSDMYNGIYSNIHNGVHSGIHTIYIAVYIRYDIYMYISVYITGWEVLAIRLHRLLLINISRNHQQLENCCCRQSMSNNLPSSKNFFQWLLVSGTGSWKLIQRKRPILETDCSKCIACTWLKFRLY